MGIVLLGAPGSGKGTVAKRLSAERGVPQISTGDILREAVRRETELGAKVKSYLSSGRLVPDDVILDMMAVRLARPDCKPGYVLDGFPRNLVQAEWLDGVAGQSGAAPDVALYIDVPEAELVKRITGRRVCPKCGEIYNVATDPPKKRGVCDADGATLEQRSDDTEGVVRDRFQEYLKQTAPVVDYYRVRGRLVTVDGVGEAGEIYARVVAGLSGHIAAEA